MDKENNEINGLPFDDTTYSSGNPDSAKDGPSGCVPREGSTTNLLKTSRVSYCKSNFSDSVEIFDDSYDIDLPMEIRGDGSLYDDILIHLNNCTSLPDLGKGSFPLEEYLGAQDELNHLNFHEQPVTTNTNTVREHEEEHIDRNPPEVFTTENSSDTKPNTTAAILKDAIEFDFSVSHLPSIKTDQPPVPGVGRVLEPVIETGVDIDDEKKGEEAFWTPDSSELENVSSCDSDILFDESEELKYLATLTSSDGASKSTALARVSLAATPNKGIEEETSPPSVESSYESVPMEVVDLSAESPEKKSDDSFGAPLITQKDLSLTVISSLEGPSVNVENEVLSVHDAEFEKLSSQKPESSLEVKLSSEHNDDEPEKVHEIKFATCYKPGRTQTALRIETLLNASSIINEVQVYVSPASVLKRADSCDSQSDLKEGNYSEVDETSDKEMNTNIGISTTETSPDDFTEKAEGLHEAKVNENGRESILEVVQPDTEIHEKENEEMEIDKFHGEVSETESERIFIGEPSTDDKYSLESLVARNNDALTSGNATKVEDCKPSHTATANVEESNRTTLPQTSLYDIEPTTSKKVSKLQDLLANVLENSSGDHRQMNDHHADKHSAKILKSQNQILSLSNVNLVVTEDLMSKESIQNEKASAVIDERSMCIESTRRVSSRKRRRSECEYETEVLHIKGLEDKCEITTDKETTTGNNRYTRSKSVKTSEKRPSSERILRSSVKQKTLQSKGLFPGVHHVEVETGTLRENLHAKELVKDAQTQGDPLETEQDVIRPTHHQTSVPDLQRPTSMTTRRRSAESVIPPESPTSEVAKRKNRRHATIGSVRNVYNTRLRIRLQKEQGTPSPPMPKLKTTRRKK